MWKITQSREDIELVEKIYNLLRELSNALEQSNVKLFLKALKNISELLGPVATPISISVSLIEVLSPVIRIITDRMQRKIKQKLQY